MKKRYFSAYNFDAKHHPMQSNVYSLKLKDGYINAVGESKRVHLEIIRINCWDELAINLNSTVISIYPVLPDGAHHLPEMRFYRQCGNSFFGEDLQTGRAIYGKISGPKDENGICAPVLISLQVSSIKFNNIKHLTKI